MAVQYQTHLPKRLHCPLLRWLIAQGSAESM